MDGTSLRRGKGFSGSLEVIHGDNMEIYGQVSHPDSLNALSKGLKAYYPLHRRSIIEVLNKNKNKNNTTV